MRKFPIFAIALLIGSVAMTSLASAQSLVLADSTSNGAPSDNGPAVTPQAADKSGPSILGYVGFGSDYIYQDFGFLASTSPTIYGGTTATWKSGDSLDFWFSKGAGGSANEIDLSYWHNGSFGSPVGKLEYQAKVSYYFLSGGGSNHLFNPADDALYAHLDIGRTFDLGRFSIGLHSKTELIDGTNDVPFFALERVGVPVDFNLTDKISAEVEIARAWNLTGNGKNPWEFTPQIAWDLGSGKSLIVKDKMAEDGRRVYHEVMIEADFPLN